MITFWPRDQLAGEKKDVNPMEGRLNAIKQDQGKTAASVLSDLGFFNPSLANIVKEYQAPIKISSQIHRR